MAYYMNYAHQSIKAPSITSLPNYVKCLMHTGVDDITIDIGDMDKSIFNALVDEIRLYFCEHCSYKHIGTYENGEWSNPYYFHIPSEKDSTISFTERDGKLEIHRANIEEVIGLMEDNGIMMNEFAGDVYGLRGIKAYDIREEAMREQIDNIREAYDSM